MAVHIEEFVAFAELVTDPKTPLAFLWTCQHDRPTTTRINFDRMFMESRAKANTASFHSVISIRGHVGITTPQNQRDEPPGMIVRITQIIAVNPVMHTNAKHAKVEHPPSEVGTLFWA